MHHRRFAVLAKGQSNARLAGALAPRNAMIARAKASAGRIARIARVGGGAPQLFAAMARPGALPLCVPFAGAGVTKNPTARAAAAMEKWIAPSARERRNARLVARSDQAE